MDVDCPDAAEGDQRGEGFEAKAEEENGEVDQAYGVDGIDGMFTVGG